VLIYIGKQRCDDETINWKQMREATEDWITYQTDYTRERGGRDVYTVEVRQPTGLFFNRIVVIPNDSWPIVEAKIDNCRMEVSVIELMTGGEVCVRGHCGRLHKAVLDGGIKPLSSIEDCVWLHPTEK
jgi:hypothetical protein